MIRATSMTHAFATAATRNPNWIARQVEDRIVHTKVGIVREKDHVNVSKTTALKVVGSIIGHIAATNKQQHPRVVADIQG
jgi:hypothetical protein